MLLNTDPLLLKHGFLMYEIRLLNQNDKLAQAKKEIIYFVIGGRGNSKLTSSPGWVR